MIKASRWFFAAFIFIVMGCEKRPEAVLLSYLETRKAVDESKTLPFLCEEDRRYLSSSKASEEKPDPVSIAMAKRSNYKTKKVEAVGNKATVFVEVRGPDFSSIWDKVYKVNEDASSEERDKALAKEIMSDSAPMKTEEGKWELVKEKKAGRLK
jgi:hypothetical protein